MDGSRGRTITVAVLGTLAALLAGGLIFMYSGAYNVAATEEHTALGGWVLSTMQNRSVAVRANEVPEPPPIDSALVEHGFEHFRAMCVVCHGAPGVERGEFGQGMTPTPPELAEAAAELGSRELFWILKHGIKMAGMPAFGPTHSDEEIWGLVAFVERLPGMSPEEYQRWESRVGGDEAAEGADAAGSGDGHTHAPGTGAHSH